ncbi:MAG: c-type cytochrome [Planctomycetes bacterium]|nr:c-type cytochrome [Planctomycetota bacterium]
MLPVSACLRVFSAGVLLAALSVEPRAFQDPSAGGGSAWGADYFPDVPLVTHEGREVRFFTDLVAGKVVVINFIYTRCPDSCPLETAKLAEVQELLGARLGNDVFFYSISIDPEHDTTEVLAEYAQRFGARAGWLFLRGAAEDVLLLRKKLGVYMADAEQGSKDHNLSFVIGNQSTGQWLRRSPFETPQVLASDIGGRMHDWKQPRGQQNDYADAPALRSLSTGENLFRLRCATCHVIGPGDGLARVGPNLVGVMERRERAWLERWLSEPDVMLAERDPIATVQFEAFNRVAMPNLRLTPQEIQEILGFVEQENERVAHLEAALAEVAANRSEAPPTCCQKREQGVLEGDVATAPAPSVLDPAPASVPQVPEDARAVVAAGDAEPTGFRLSLAARLSIACGLLLGAATLLGSRLRT